MRLGNRGFERIASATREIPYGARSIEPQIATYVVLVWRCRSARHGSGCTRGSICRARAGGISSTSWWRSRMRRNEAGEDGEHRLPIGLVIGSVERALLMLTTSVGAARSSRASLAVQGGVTPGHAVTPASMFGKMLRRSSPTATALTRDLHRGLAVSLAEGKFSTAEAVALAGAPSSSLPAVGVARFDFGQGSWRGLRWPGCCEADVRRRCAAPGRMRCRGGGGEGRRFERERRSREARRCNARVEHGEKGGADRRRRAATGS